jgi:hypothetical protein
MKHKSEDYKISAVKYYIKNKVSMDKTNGRLLRDTALNNKFKNYLNLLFIFIIIQKK